MLEPVQDSLRCLQTEKQRIIWAYKILFLDVLFPLSLRKVIFMDSDQIIRADVAELWHMDLEVSSIPPSCLRWSERRSSQFPKNFSNNHAMLRQSSHDSHLRTLSHWWGAWRCFRLVWEEGR